MAARTAPIPPIGRRPAARARTLSTQRPITSDPSSADSFAASSHTVCTARSGSTPSPASAAAAGNAVRSRAAPINEPAERGATRSATATSSRAGSVMPGRTWSPRSTTGSAPTASTRTDAARTEAQAVIACHAAASTIWQPHGNPLRLPGAGRPGTPPSP